LRPSAETRRNSGIEVFGNTNGLSPQALKSLERIYRRRVPLDDLSTAELNRSLVEASAETGRQVGVLVHRSGAVDYVIVGDAQKLELPDIGRLRASQGRFRGLRLIHTHPNGEALTRDDLIDLTRLRLDLVAVLQLNARGEPKAVSYAHNIPTEDPDEPPYREIGPLSLGAAHVDVGELMQNLEAEFARRVKARDVRAKDGRAILIHVASKSERGYRIATEESVRELQELARTAGTEVADVIVQAREHLDPRFVMGRGKLDEVILRAMQLDVDVLIFDRELSPRQAAAIAKAADLKVIDRTQLILDIFAQRAESADGKLQVELAQLKYSLPRLQMKDDSLSRLTGGIGGRGPGETKLEIGKRRAKERVSHLELELRALGKRREERRKKRARGDVPTVAIVGYTNAGKSTLLNTLTGATVLAEDKLFATLDTRSRHIRVGWAGYGEREVILTDTVGFIRSLPRDLFAAFRATFEEAADAHVLVHVVDASDPSREEHMKTTENVLADLDLQEIPRIVVFNKSDLLEPFARGLLAKQFPEAVFLSALDRESTRALVERVAKTLAEKWETSLKGPPSVAVEEALDDEPISPEPDDVHAVTLDDMLRRSGRRSKLTEKPS